MTSEQFIFIESKGSFKTTELLKINLMWCDLWELPRLLNTQFWGYYPVCNKKRSTRFRNLCPQKLGWSANSPGETKVKAECKREQSVISSFSLPRWVCFRFCMLSFFIVWPSKLSVLSLQALCRLPGASVSTGDLSIPSQTGLASSLKRSHCLHAAHYTFLNQVFWFDHTQTQKLRRLSLCW